MAATLTVPDLPDELYVWLSEQAARNHQPIDKEVIALLAALRQKSAAGVAKPAVSRETAMSIIARCVALPDLDARSAEEILDYDSSGLPK